MPGDMKLGDLIEEYLQTDRDLAGVFKFKPTNEREWHWKTDKIVELKAKKARYVRAMNDIPVTVTVTKAPVTEVPHASEGISQEAIRPA